MLPLTLGLQLKRSLKSLSTQKMDFSGVSLDLSREVLLFQLPEAPSSPFSKRLVGG